MNKKNIIGMLSILGILIISVFVTATGPFSLIYGTVTNKTTNATVFNATVQVRCYHNGTIQAQTLKTDGDGNYYAFYLANLCDTGDIGVAYVGTKANANYLVYSNSTGINWDRLNIKI